MLFNSWEFLQFFPVVTLLYFQLPHRFRWMLLLAASYFFYMSWKPAYLLLILASTGIDYSCALGMGIRLVLLPIPKKSTLYHDLLPDGVERNSDYISRLVEAVRAAGVEALDTLALLEAARRNDPELLLYHTDDSHWGPAGVRVVAAGLADMIRQDAGIAPN